MTTMQAQLSPSSLAWLQELIQANIDSRDGFSEAAANLRPGAPLATMFSRAARQRGMQVEELQDIVASSDALPKHSGTLMGAAHRIWMDLRAAFGGGEQALLSEAAASEDRMLRRYDEALNEFEDCECGEVLRKHLAAIRSSHEKIHALLDSCNVGCS